MNRTNVQCSPTYKGWTPSGHVKNTRKSTQERTLKELNLHYKSTYTGAMELESQLAVRVILKGARLSWLLCVPFSKLPIFQRDQNSQCSRAWRVHVKLQSPRAAIKAHVDQQRHLMDKALYLFHVFHIKIVTFFKNIWNILHWCEKYSWKKTWERSHRFVCVCVHTNWKCNTTCIYPTKDGWIRTHSTPFGAECCRWWGRQLREQHTKLGSHAPSSRTAVVWLFTFIPFLYPSHEMGVCKPLLHTYIKPSPRLQLGPQRFYSLLWRLSSFLPPSPGSSEQTSMPVISYPDLIRFVPRCALAVMRVKLL